MNTDKGIANGEACTYRLIDLFTDLAARMHTYGIDAYVKIRDNGWMIEAQKTEPNELRLLEMVESIASYLNDFGPDAKITLCSRGYSRLNGNPIVL